MHILLCYSRNLRDISAFFLFPLGNRCTSCNASYATCGMSKWSFRPIFHNMDTRALADVCMQIYTCIYLYFVRRRTFLSKNIIYFLIFFFIHLLSRSLSLSLYIYIYIYMYISILSFIFPLFLLFPTQLQMPCIEVRHLKRGVFGMTINCIWVWSIPSWSLLSGPLWPWVVVPVTLSNGVYALSQSVLVSLKINTKICFPKPFS